MATDAPSERPPRTSVWQDATVVGIRRETWRAATIQLDLAEPLGHLAGQHVVVRLTAADGYTASRSYSIANPPDGSSVIELTVERLEDGEVSTFLHDVLEVGDTVEVRGPIGGWFVWRGDRPLLVGGGSGLVPLVAMLRLARSAGVADLVHLVASVRTPADLLYADEFLDVTDAPPANGVSLVFTREAPPGHPRPPGRLTAGDLAAALAATPAGPTVFVCGSAGFADHVTGLLAGLAVPTERVRVERFGPSN